jgi:hypothetical protein
MTGIRSIQIQPQILLKLLAVETAIDSLLGKQYASCLTLDFGFWIFSFSGEMKMTSAPLCLFRKVLVRLCSAELSMA